MSLIIVSDVLCVTVVQGLYGRGVNYTSTDICAVKGSTVEIRCSFTFKSWYTTVEKMFWFTQKKGGDRVNLKTDSEYAGRVENCCKNRICILRIKNLTESDSAEYKFRFDTIQEGGSYIGSPGVTLSVTGNIFLYVSYFQMFST